MGAVISKYFVTGGSGLLGSAVVRSLKENNKNVVAPTHAQLDLTDESKVREFLEDSSPDFIIHTAAKVGGIKANIAEPVEFLLRNMQIDSAVFSACDSVGIENMLYIGSSCMYPRDAAQPFEPSSLFTGRLEQTNEAYAIAKLAGAKLAQLISEKQNRHYKTVVLSNLYGPGDHLNSINAHLLAAIIHKIHIALIQGDRVVQIGGSGLPRREFTFVGDVADWIAKNIDKLANFPPYLNLGAGEDFSVTEFYEKAAKVMGYAGTFVFDTSFPDGMAAKLMNSTPALQSHAWSPIVTLEEGIETTYEWWKNAQN